MWSGEWRVEAATLLCAVVLDLATREAPPALHPVVWMRRLIAWLEGLLPAPERKAASLAAGIGLAGVVPAVFEGLARHGRRSNAPGASRRLCGRGSRSPQHDLRGQGTGTRRHKNASGHGSGDGDGDGARRSLVSHDTRTLAPPMVAMAASESVAENTPDGFVGPWPAFALFGLPGAFAYRAINTLDSMIGYRAGTST